MEIGAFEAKNRLSNLLERAERGEEIVITRRGKPVARLVPFRDKATHEQAREAARRMRERARAMKLGPFDWEYWKGLVNEGRP